VSLSLVPMTFAEATEFVRNFHRHNKRPTGLVFVLGASDGEQLVGVAIVGRPVARMLQDGETLEVLRCCVVDEAPKGTCSFLYSRAWRAAAALGWRKLITYTLQTESGASLRGAGWRVVNQCPERSAAGWQNRPGREWQEVVGQSKFRWEAA
jgi:hypothetical protein